MKTQKEEEEEEEGERVGGGGGGVGNSAKVAVPSSATSPLLLALLLPAPPATLVYSRIVLGEVTPLLAAMKRTAGQRWSGQPQVESDPLVAGLRDLHRRVSDLTPGDPPMPPHQYLEPFLEVVKSEDTTGPVTRDALAAVNRMIGYGLLDPQDTSPQSLAEAAAAAEGVAAAVTRARFVGTEAAADEAVLFGILWVLRALVLSRAGPLLSNDALCEILNSAFRICFETRLSDLLRTCTEEALRQMVTFIFSRLPLYPAHDLAAPPTLTDGARSHPHHKVKMRAGGGHVKGSPPVTPAPEEVTSTLGAVNPGLADINPAHAEINPCDTEMNPAHAEMNPAHAEMNPAHAEINPAHAEINPGDTEINSAHDEVNPCDTEINPAHTEMNPEIVEQDSPRQMDQDNLQGGADGLGASEGLDGQEGLLGASGWDGEAKGPHQEALKIGVGLKPETQEEEEEEEEAVAATAVVVGTDRQTDISTAHLATPDADDAERTTHTEHGAAPQRPRTSPDDCRRQYVNAQGVRFTSAGGAGELAGAGVQPFGLLCVRELLRFLVSLTTPLNEQNTPAMVAAALNLLTVALEVGGRHMAKVPALMSLLRDQLCRNLVHILAHAHVRLQVYMGALRLCALMCESFRAHMKYQVERVVTVLLEIVTSEAPHVSYAHRELALEALVALWRLDGFTVELFANFDCDTYATNVLEDTVKTLSKHVFPVQGLFSTNLLCLEGLVVLVEQVEARGHTLDHKPPLTDHTETEETASLTTHAPAVENGNCARQEIPCALACAECGRGGAPRLVARTTLTDDNVLEATGLLRAKRQKDIIASGSDLFNHKPEKGIAFLIEHGILGAGDGCMEDSIARFLRQNPRLCKKALGTYLSSKKNVDVLAAFVRSFDFQGLRVDEALRVFLESFRLPGEAPLISLIMETFAAHWYTANAGHTDVTSADAAFTLAYAVIILNVDQHNRNARKQNTPMTLDQFRANLRGVNDGGDFDPDTLASVYTAVKTEEFVMPSEQTGAVREEYLWRTMLRRGHTRDGVYLLANGTAALDREIFLLAWGPTVASLSYVYDKTGEEAALRRVLGAFGTVASCAARFGMCDVFDNVVVTLCKFTALSHGGEAAAASFGTSVKGQLATRCVLDLVIEYGDCVRDGWRNVVEVLVRLFCCHLLPGHLTEGVDFVAASGKVSLQPAPSLSQPLRAESSLLSSLYSYIALGDAHATRAHTHTDPETVTCARACVRECHPERIISESVYLRTHTLMELVRALLTAAHTYTQTDTYMEAGPDTHTDMHTQAFLMELCARILTANKDRVHRVWPCVSGSMYAIFMCATSRERVYVLERACVCLLRFTQVLLRRPTEGWSQVIQWLLTLRPRLMARVSRQVMFGLKEILTANSENVQPNEWDLLFALVEYAGAGVRPPPSLLEGVGAGAAAAGEEAEEAADSDGTIDSGVGSDDQPQLLPQLPASDDPNVGRSSHQPASPPPLPQQLLSAQNSQLARTESPDSSTGGWILVGRGGEVEQQQQQQQQQQLPQSTTPMLPSPYTLVPPILPQSRHRAKNLMAAVGTLSFLARECLLPYNHTTPAPPRPPGPPVALASATRATRSMVEAALNAGLINQQLSQKHHNHSNHNYQHSKKKKKKTKKRNHNNHNNQHSGSDSEGDDNADDDEDNVGCGGDGGGGNHNLIYQQVSEKLLDLLGSLHTSAGQLSAVYQHPATTATTTTTIDLWNIALCPLLQGIARLCCDCRPNVRGQALTTLQRALLTHDLVALTPAQWEGLFHRVLFPLLHGLAHLPHHHQPHQQQPHLEEARLRAATLVMKVYLRHLSPLLTLPTFTALWLTILEFLDKYLSLSNDHLREAVPEMLKNMLLVMETTQVFHTTEGFTKLWSITWDRIDAFLPSLRHNIFRSHPPSEIHGHDPVTTTTTTTTTGILEEESEREREKIIPPTLREQQAARLSLSQEDLPAIIENSSVILQPPLPAPQVASPVSQSEPSLAEKGRGSSQSERSIPVAVNQSSVPIILQKLPVFTEDT